MADMNVKIKTVGVVRGETDADFPYTVFAYAEDADTGEPQYAEFVNTGAFADAGETLDAMYANIPWIVVN